MYRSGRSPNSTGKGHTIGPNDRGWPGPFDDQSNELRFQCLGAIQNHIDAAVFELDVGYRLLGPSTARRIGRDEYRSAGCDTPAEEIRTAMLEGQRVTVGRNGFRVDSRTTGIRRRSSSGVPSCTRMDSLGLIVRISS